jgi:hypothetical protein
VAAVVGLYVSHTLADLRAKLIAELIAEHDHLAKTTGVGVNYSTNSRVAMLRRSPRPSPATPKQSRQR